VHVPLALKREVAQATKYAHFESVWIPIAPSANERQVMFSASQADHLIQQEESGLIVETSKGCEHQEWRGGLPVLTSDSTGRSWRRAC
jgi:hypothetical protein